MRPNEFTERNKLRPGYIVNPSRYVMGRIHSHRRPVTTPPSKRPPDDPATRGLTRLDDQTT